MRDNRGSQKTVCTLILIRHAASIGSGSFAGQNDERLSAAGLKQLPELVEKLSRFNFQVAFSSDLKRCLVTARAAVQHRNVELDIRPGLREMDFGRWQGLSWPQVERRYPRLAAAWLKNFSSQSIPGAEPLADFMRRVRTELKKIVSTNHGRCVLVVAHAGVIRVALADALGMKKRNMFRMAQDPCAVNVIDYFEDGVTVRCVNG